MLPLLEKIFSRFSSAAPESEEQHVFVIANYDGSVEKKFRKWWDSHKKAVKKRSIKDRLVNVRNIARESFYAGHGEGERKEDNESN